MEIIGSKTEIPSESVCRSTRRARSNKSIVKLDECKDQENVNSRSSEKIIHTGIRDDARKIMTTEVKINSTTVYLNSSTPRRKKDPLANLQSNLSPKYIGFTTPPNILNNSTEEITRSLRRRHNNSVNNGNISEDAEIDIKFTPNNENTVGFVRCTTRNIDSPLTPDNSTHGKTFVSPIDKLLIKNGAVMDFNINLTLVDNDDLNFKNKDVLINSKSKNNLNVMELCLKEVEGFNERLQNNHLSTSIGNISSISTKIGKETNVIESDVDVVDDEEGKKINVSNVSNIKDNENKYTNDGIDNDFPQDKSVEILENSQSEELLDKVNEINLNTDNSNTLVQYKTENGIKQHQIKENVEKKNKDPERNLPIIETVEDNLEISEYRKSVIKSRREIIEQNKRDLVKIKLEFGEIEDNDEFVNDPPISAKSPSAISTDSAKGSSIINEASWISFSTGDLYWGQIYNYCYWPCMVCPDPDGKTIVREDIGRWGGQTVLVHVRFFADNGRRNWVKRENLMPFNGVENYQQRMVEIREKYGIKSLKYKLYVPPKKKEKVWYEAVNEANIVAEVAFANRLKKFFEIFEKSKAFQKLEKQRRKSLYVSLNSGPGSEMERLHDSNYDTNSVPVTAVLKNKRERSISPYSPAYSPVKALPAKRRKLSRDLDLASTSDCGSVAITKMEENACNEDLNLIKSDSIVSTSFKTNSLSDLGIFNGLEFKKFYAVMKDFVIEQNHNEKLEKSLIIAVRNIWALKQLGRKQMERKLRESISEADLSPALALTNTRSTSEGSVKRLSSRLKTLMVRKSLMAEQRNKFSPEKSVTPSPNTKSQNVKPMKKTLNRPILEVIDDIFDLDTKYLFKGMCRDPVCKYCFKPGENLKRCAKNCTYWLHKNCLYKDYKKQKGRGHKTQNHTTTDSDTVSGAQSSLVTGSEVDNYATVEANAFPDVVICKECSNNEQIKCMVCCSTTCKRDDDPLVKCTMAQCERTFHPSCCKYWPQAKLTMSKNLIQSFRCPSHVCHTCVSDDPKGKFQHISNSKLTKCVQCPATFHTDSTCIPAGSQILTASHIICPRHSSSKHDMTVNVNWCFICVGGGQLTCCETCPTAVHAFCLKIPIAANEGYICEECESGRMPLYGEMVWAKFNNFRWWPAIILPPTEVPKNIARKKHNPSDFVVRFFGTHDHGWISRRRVYLYLEGDSSEPPKSKSGLDLSYNKGIEEAKEIYEIVKAKKVKQRNSNENKEKLHPQPYVRIKANRAVPPVKLHINIESVNKCECDPRVENPCGADTNCLNRVLYHECNPKLCPAGERCQNQMFESRISPRLDVVYMKERGFGLVCLEPIKSGCFIIEYVGEIINFDEFQSRVQQKSRDRDENFYFLSVEKDYIIDAGPKGNLARFMNHSCDPNCETQKWSVNSLNRVGLFAIKDIPQNTELTFNYHWDDILGNEKKTCYCGASKCAGQIGGKIKDLETTKESTTAVNEISKNKSKIKGKRNKKLAKGLLKNKFVSKLKLKPKVKTISKKSVVAAVRSIDDVDSAIEKSEVNEGSTSRILISPDLFFEQL